MKPLVVISCPIETMSGYGARARDIVKALLKHDKYDVKVISQRWGNTAWVWTSEADAYIMKKKESIGPKFTKIQQDGVKENVWTEECTANKVKNRYHQLNRSSKRPSGWVV